MDQLVALFELIQTVTQGCGAHGAEFAQLLSGDRGLELGEGLADLFQGRRFARGGRDGRGLDQRQRQGLVGLGQPQGEVILGRGGAMFGGQSELISPATHIKVRIAPAMEFTGPAQGLAGPGTVSVFTRVMDQQDG